MLRKHAVRLIVSTCLVFSCVQGSAAVSFIRGDTNADGNVEFQDATILLVSLFGGGGDPPCRDAADADGDGILALTDVVFLLDYVFAGGPQPPAPYPSCGIAGQKLGCESFPPCDAQGPAAPLDVMASAESGDGTVTIEWSASSGARSYNLYWSEGDEVSVDTGARVENVSSPYVHTDRVDNTTYSYVVTAVNATGESEPSAVVRVTPRSPRISGTTLMPPLEVSYVNDMNAGGLYSICLYDLGWEGAVDCDYEADPACNCDIVTEANPDTGEDEGILTPERPFSFNVERGRAYILVASYGGGQAIAALTPIIVADTVQDITLDSEVAFNLIAVLEREHNSVDPGDLRSLAPRMDTLLERANLAVERLNFFYADRNDSREADRFTEAVRNFTLDRLNQSSAVFTHELVPDTIRAYGGGLGAMPTLDDVVNNPQTPLNPHFTFTRETDQSFDAGMSDLATERWDYLASDAVSPHIPIGGNKVVYASLNGTSNAGGYPVQGIFLKDLGGDPRRLATPENMYAVTPSLSPDQTRVALAGFLTDLSVETPISGSRPFNLFVLEIDPATNERRRLTQITFDNDLSASASSFRGNYYTDWSPDGEWIVFARVVQDPWINQIVRIRRDGSERTVIVDAATNGISLGHSPKWSADAREIVFSGLWPGETHSRVLGTTPDAVDPAQRLFRRYTDGSRSATQSAVSYDGRFIMYATFDDNLTATLHILNRYTHEVVEELGNFASARSYLYPRFTATEAVMVAVEGTVTDDSGTVDTEATNGTDRRTTSTSSSYNYYREIIPAANAIGVNFNVTSWW